MPSPDNHIPPLDFLALNPPDRLHVAGLSRLSPGAFVAFVAGLTAYEELSIEFENGASRDGDLKRYRASLRHTRADMADFAASANCAHRLASKSVTGAWNGLRITHVNIQRAKKGDGHGAWAGRSRMLDAKQVALFRTLPLAFVVPNRLEHSDASDGELLVSSLYDTLKILERRSDRTDFVERVSRKSMLFLAEFASHYSPDREPIHFADWETK